MHLQSDTTLVDTLPGKNSEDFSMIKRVNLPTSSPGISSPLPLGQYCSHVPVSTKRILTDIDIALGVRKGA